MRLFESIEELKVRCRELSKPDPDSASVVAARQKLLTKPKGSLGQLEEIVIWLGQWQRRSKPVLDRVEILIFAATHGINKHHVSAYPPEVTMQMVANFESGGAAINQLARFSNAKLQIIPIELDHPTADFVEKPAMTDEEFLSAVELGYNSVPKDADLICVGEMGIGNTTASSALCAALFGGDGRLWAGRGTGIDEATLSRKQRVIDLALQRHSQRNLDPLGCAATFGGRELAAILGATLGARHKDIPVILDGFVCTAAVAPLFKIDQRALDHTVVGHVSSEAGHQRLLDMLGLVPILDLAMRLGEGSGAALAITILRAALACYVGMSTFAEAGVANKSPPLAAEKKLV